MKRLRRAMGVVVVVGLAVSGPLRPLAAAEQTAAETRRGPDAYDVAAGAMTVIGAPLKAAVCGLGGAVGLALFVLTFGSADRAAAAVVREGCEQRWVVRGEDIRPEPPASSIVESDRQAWSGGR
jgi:hypothetical protein